MAASILESSEITSRLRVPWSGGVRKINRWAAGARVCVLLLFGCCFGTWARAAGDPAAAIKLDGALTTPQEAIFKLCFKLDSSSDPAKLKAVADACMPLLAALKAGSDLDANNLQQQYARVHTQYLDGQALAREKIETSWGASWMTALIVIDIVAVVIGLGVLGMAIVGSGGIDILREPDASGGAPGKVSFSRVIGLVGGLTAFVFVAFLTNVCLSHLFLTGKMPDQLGTTYAAGVGTLITALVPYVFNKAVAK
jgi:hypothetical protein